MVLSRRREPMRKSRATRPHSTDIRLDATCLKLLIAWYTVGIPMQALPDSSKVLTRSRKVKSRPRLGTLVELGKGRKHCLQPQTYSYFRAACSLSPLSRYPTKSESKMTDTNKELSPYVTLVSADGFEFHVRRSAACVSGTIRRMLDVQSVYIANPPRQLQLTNVQTTSVKLKAVSVILRTSVALSLRRSSSTSTTTKNTEKALG